MNGQRPPAPVDAEIRTDADTLDGLLARLLAETPPTAGTLAAVCRKLTPVKTKADLGRAKERSA